MDTPVEATDDVQSRILQSTLTEVALRKPLSTSADPTNSTATESNPRETRCCVICLDAITEACEARPCSHNDFDYLCLLSWLEQQAKCPLCKSDVSEVLYGFHDQGGGGGDGSRGHVKTYKVPPPKQPAAPSQHRSGASRVDPSDFVAAHIYTGLGAHNSRNYNDSNYSNNRRRRFRSPRQDRWRVVPEDEALRRRQQVYRDQLYSLHVGANRTSRYRRELTPQMFNDDPELVSRARIFLRRELHVFEFLQASASSSSTSSSTTTPANLPRGGGGGASSRTDETMNRRRANNAEFLLEYIIAILKTVDVQGSRGQAEDMLADFLGRDNARLLLHELRGFLRSPYSLEAWDRHVQYPPVEGEPSSSRNKRYPRSNEEGSDDDHDRRQYSRRRRRSRSPLEASPGPERARRGRNFDGRRGTGAGGSLGADLYRPAYSRRDDAYRARNPDDTPI